MVKAHHFAHVDGLECAAAFESALHLLAKQLLEDSRGLGLPAVGADRPIPGESRLLRCMLAPEEVATFAAVRTEVRSADGAVVVDAVGEGAERPVHIEFAVTHFCEPEKIEWFREHDISAIEIDLRHVTLHRDPEAVAMDILHRAPRRWLSHPRLAEAEALLDGCLAELAARKAAEAERLRRAEEERRKAEAERREAEEEARRRALENRHRRIETGLAPAVQMVRTIADSRRDVTDGGLPDEVRRMAEALDDVGLGLAVDRSIRGDRFFEVSRRCWQVIVTHRFVYQLWGRTGTQAMFKDSWVVDKLIEHGCINKQMVFLYKEMIAKIQDEFPDFQKPSMVVQDYLDYLAAMRLIERCGRVNKEYGYWWKVLPSLNDPALPKWRKWQIRLRE